jgi:tetratricopeptide (TPR) repeat protein
MTKSCIRLAGGLVACAIALAGPMPPALASEASPAPVTLFENLGEYHRPITTSSERAQRYFDQGLRLYYGFNLPEATRAFEEAARLDPGCAMAWWGVAVTAGPNYNSPIDSERNARALAAIAKARSAAGSQVEQEYVAALAKRYSADPAADRAALDHAYADAMRELAGRHPEDPDATILYAEALMNLRPWDLYTVDGKPQPGTEKIVSILEGEIARNPRHPGAHHFYIHAVEPSQNPERALASAKALETLVPGAGHLVHMPGHIYMRVGRYADATEANRRAVAVDRAYIAREKPTGEYVMMYYPHNLDFLWAAASMDGRSEEAIRASRDLAGEAPIAMLRQMPDMEGVATTPVLVLARFGRWDEILAEPPPPADLAFAAALDHYARGLALVRKGRLEDAAVEEKALAAATEAMPPERVVMQVNFAKRLLELASNVLSGELASARGDNDAAVRDLRAAVAIQDGLRYMEPPPWYFPVRQALGAALLRAGRPADAAAVYREDLERNPENGWSLLGLSQSLAAAGDAAGAAAANERFRKSWARADVEIEASVF